jgi:hypothetical protein
MGRRFRQQGPPPGLRRQTIQSKGIALDAKLDALIIGRSCTTSATQRTPTCTATIKLSSPNQNQHQNQNQKLLLPKQERDQNKTSQSRKKMPILQLTLA